MPASFDSSSDDDTLRAVPALRVGPWTTCPPTAQGYGRPAVGECAGLSTGFLAGLLVI